MSANQSIIQFEINKVNNLPELVELVDVVREEVKGLIGPAHSARVNNLFFFTNDQLPLIAVPLIFRHQ